MPITSKKGDQGKSYWLDREVDKDDPLLEFLGSVDELQCMLGVTKAEIEYGFIKNQIEEIQKDLWSLAGRVAGYDEKQKVALIDLKKRTREMEVDIEAWERKLPVLRKFVLPGENRKEASLHFCRALVRRVERKLVTLNREKKQSSDMLPYLNRLSDYLFMLANEISN